jgi:release factor glutamine methyltransferase
LAQHDIDEADLDARLLLEYVCGTDRNTLLVHGDREVSDAEQERYLKLIGKRGQHVPLQHLTGEQDFMGLTFKVNEHVLVPRQDTEILVEEVMKNLKPAAVFQ